MAIELKYEKYIQDCLKNVQKKVNTVAFGRTIPVKQRPWIPHETDTLITTAYPEELLSFEKLFKGITHLRSTGTLINFYKKHPKLMKPKYLVDSGCFKDKLQETAQAEVPLYERLQLKY